MDLAKPSSKGKVDRQNKSAFSNLMNTVTVSESIPIWQNFLVPKGMFKQSLEKHRAFSGNKSLLSHRRHPSIILCRGGIVQYTIFCCLTVRDFCHGFYYPFGRNSIECIVQQFFIQVVQLFMELFSSSFVRLMQKQFWMRKTFYGLAFKVEKSFDPFETWMKELLMDYFSHVSLHFVGSFIICQLP